MPDLRRAVAWALAQGSTATTDEVAAIGETDAHTALRYLRALSRAAEPVAVERDGNWSAGRGFKAWAAQRTTTKVGNGGNSRGYRQAKAARDAIRARAWKESREAVLTCTSSAASRQEPPGAAKMKNEGRRSVYLSLDAAAVQLGMSRRTIDRHVAAGRIKVARLTCRMVRVCQDEVERFARERETTWQSA